MGSGAPLLNEYKQEFLWKRFPQTVLGGPKLRLGYNAPAFVYLNQVLLFLMPWVLGGICTILVEYNVMKYDIGLYLYGALMTLFVLIVNITSAIILRKKGAVSDINLNANQNILSEDDEVDFASCCGKETVHFILPGKKFEIMVMIHAVLSGLTCALGMRYLLPQTLNSLYSNNMAATVLLYMFGWVVICIIQYSLTVRPPPECACFTSHDPYEIILPTSRPFYALVFYSVDLLARHYEGFVIANQVLHVVFLVLPVLWVLGALAPLDALLLWIAEQVLVILFGGSPMATTLRLLLIVLLSVVVFVAIYFIPPGLHTVVLMASFGYILSTDLARLGRQLLAFCKKQKPDDFQHHRQNFLWLWGVKEVLFHILVLVMTASTAGAVNYTTRDLNTDITSYLGHVATGLCILERLLSELQSVYMFGMWRNKFYPSSVQRITVFTRSKRRLATLGYIHRVVLNFASPLVMLMYLSASIHFTTPSRNGTITASKAASILGANRAFRWVWQNTGASLLEISVVHVISLALPSSETSWTNLGVGLQLLLISLMRDRLYQFFGKLWFYVTILVTSWTDKQHHRKSTVPVIIVNILLLPLIIVIIAAASALSAPLMPLFTLPLMLIGFPRPLRSWPGPVGGSANTCADSVFYEHLGPQLAAALGNAFGMGSLGSPSPGRIILVRFQDRMVWVQVLESGFSFCTLSIKGLELQETSCHTTEATRLDDILETTFENEGAFSCCSWNKYPLCVLRPYDAATIKTYSDAKNQLTGVIDSPDTLQNVAKGFSKTLVWVLLHHVAQERSKSKLHGVRHLNSQVDEQYATHDSINEHVTTRNLSTECKHFCPSNTSEALIESGDADDLSLSGLLEDKKKSPRPSSSCSKKSVSDSIWSSDSLALEHLGSPKQNKVNLTQGFGHTAGKGLNQTLSPVENDCKHISSPTDLISDGNLGLPVMDVFKSNPFADNPLFSHPKSDNVLSVKHATCGLTHLSDSCCSQVLSPPVSWREIPIAPETLTKLTGGFPRDWYKYVIEMLKLDEEGEMENGTSTICKDTVLEDMYAGIISACHAVVNLLGFAGSDVVAMGVTHVHKVYSGDIPWSTASSWITDNQDLKALVVKAYRYAVKLAIDQMILGGADSDEELAEYMTEYDRDWYIGVETEPQWKAAIQQETPTLFSFTHNPVQGTYNGRVLTCQDVSIYIGGLSWEAVRGQWANLSLELLYMTNDDEERYSIQAHPTLLRNLTVQAADPPLGYPIYSSPPVSISTL